MRALGSSSVSAAGYDAESRTLAITFKGGRTYRYTEVPQSVFENLLQAKSVGKFVSTSVVGKFALEKQRKDPK